MQIKSMELAWIVVKDLKKALKFYTEVVGLKLKEEHEAFGWAELQGYAGGARLGLAQTSSEEPLEAGSNAVVTLTIENIEEAIRELKTKGAHIVGELMEIPGHVKLQSVKDSDGNQFQLVQKLS